MLVGNAVVVASADASNLPPWPLCQILKCLKASCKGDGSVNRWGGAVSWVREMVEKLDLSCFCVPVLRRHDLRYLTGAHIQSIMCYPEKAFALLTSTHKHPEVPRIHVVMVRHGGNKGTPQTRGSVDDKQLGYTPFDETLGLSVILRPQEKA